MRIAASRSLCSQRWSSSLSTYWHAADLKVLRHHHLTADHPSGLVSYEEAEEIQEELRSDFLAWKSRPDQPSHHPSDNSTVIDCPRPHLLSFEATPTFSLGRRQPDLTVEQSTRLHRDLHVDLPNRRHPCRVKLIYQIRACRQKPHDLFGHWHKRNNQH